MSGSLRAVAMLGGTFDPIHIGHLRSAVELRERCGFEHIRFVPCHQPPHRQTPGATSAQRLRMVELALAGERGLAVDDRELRREGPSYTVDTLAELRTEFGVGVSLSLALGMDAFAGLDSWHRWNELLEFAHLVVIARPDSAPPQRGPVAQLLEQRRADAAVLQREPCGAIVSVELTPLPVSATALRASIGAGRSPRYLLPDAVLHYIRQHHLYVSAGSESAGRMTTN